MLNLYCAFECERRENWQALTPPPQKPGNVGEQKWRDEKLPEKWKELEVEAPLHFQAGRVSSITVLDEVRTMYQGIASGFVDFLLEAASQHSDGIYLFAFDATERLRQMLWTVTQEGGVAPFWLWTGTSENRYSEFAMKFAARGWPKFVAVDPMCVSGAQGQKIPWNSWINAWGIKPQSPGTSWAAVHTAEVVRQIVRRMGYA